MTDGAGCTIGRFEILKTLGKGSQGRVYLGKDPVLDRCVAIKVLTPSQTELNSKSDNGAPLEAVIASKLNHPNIVPIYDAGECDIGPYLVFEYVEGDTLDQVLKSRGPYTIEGAVPLFSAILKALAAAHSSEILHLDLSSRNILVDREGTPRIMDFGLAQFASCVPEGGEMASGTLRYMTPEHFLGEPLGTWTDVFALGSTFYELITGRHAMRGTAFEDIRDRIVSAAIDLSVLNAHPHGQAFAQFLAGAFEKEREGRYTNCSVMNEAFELFLKESNLGDRVDGAGSTHSTIDFLMRRMQRKQDFPTISSTLADINRLAGDGSNASADKLANVILRDLALTSKLLKLVNSAYYGSRSSEVTSISQAVVFLGVQTVRMTANSLTLFGHLKGDSAVLRDSMIKSFLSGLIARHLARRSHLPDVEEAFICGMCQNLGENLVIYYFADEFDEITALRESRQLDKPAASRGVLGVSYADLGAAVAGSWGLPHSIVDAIKGRPPGPVSEPAGDDERIRDLAVFSNRLCDLFLERSDEDFTSALRNLLDDFGASVALEEDYALKLVNAGFEKLNQYSQLFELDVAKSAYCRAVRSWLNDKLGDAENPAALATQP